MKEINFNPADFEPLRQVALQFPDASDSLSHYDTPSVKIKKNLLARLHENGEFITIIHISACMCVDIVWKF